MALILNHMKKIVYLFLAAVCLSVASCKEKDEIQHNIVGEWYYSDEESGQEIDIYAAFSADGTFDLYQKIGEGAHRHLKGSYMFLSRTLMTGVYSDGRPWASDYEISLHEGMMTMTSTAVEGYSITYTKKRIPEEVKNHCVELTKSADGFVPFL